VSQRIVSDPILRIYTPNIILQLRFCRELAMSALEHLRIAVQSHTYLTDWFHGFYPARVRKSLSLKTLVSAAD